MLLRPRGIPEVVWSTAGALLLVVLRLTPVSLAGYAVAEGLDVYLFLTGMMMLSELAKTHGVFDWLASLAMKHSGSSPVKLFTLIYCVGTIVTIFMSNDATAVVLTPAVLAAVKRAKAQPVPYLLICAFIANAASFVLPISNPANLVVFHASMPPLARWLSMFALSSVISIVTTYLLLRWYCRNELKQAFEAEETAIRLSAGGRLALAGILGVTGVLLVASALRMNLGLPTCLASLVIAAVLSIRERMNPVNLIREISWSVLPLVAALFVIVEAVKSVGALNLLRGALLGSTHWPVAPAALLTGGIVGFGTNLVNNLPLGLIAGAAIQTVPLQNALSKAVLIGVDLGPNLSITGSLATILWLIAIRREGLHISSRQFLKAGIIVMPPALLLAVGAELLTHR